MIAHANPYLEFEPLTAPQGLAKLDDRFELQAGMDSSYRST